MSTRPLPISPVVVGVFVRHSLDCKYKGDESWKRCRCAKHVRWTFDGVQHKRAAKTRSWAQAEEVKRSIEDQYRGGATSAAPTEPDARMTVARARELFLMSKAGQVGNDVLKKYERELKRLEDFLDGRGKFTLGAIDAEDIIEFQAGWTEYGSKQTRRRVITRYRSFFRYCLKRKWIADVPEFDRVPADTASDLPTLPLSEKQYAKLLTTVPETFTGDKANRVHAIVQLMRHSGLAIRDAVTLERSELHHDRKRGLHKVVTSRQKTDTHVSVPIPPDIARELLRVPNDNPRYFFWNTGTGKPQSAVTNWQHDLRELFRAAGFLEGHPHQLRDTFAVRLLEKGVPMEEVSKALGHESIKTTEKYYAKWDRGRQNRLDSLIQGTWGSKTKSPQGY